MGDVVLKMGQVESTLDSSDGLRIKVRLAQDGMVGLNELPYAFPLLPKTIQTVPKVGECVLVVTSILGNNESNRYYIGPIISQPQFQYEDKYEHGRGTAISLLQGGKREPLEKISNYNSTNGAFPKINDVALVGRKTEDVILKDGEIDLRCGIRGKAINDDNLLGEVVFNKQSPAYIQMKYKVGLTSGDKLDSDSMINIVADKINILSHKDKNYPNLTDQNELIKEEDLVSIMESLHRVPHGDVLIEALKTMSKAIVTHVHPYPGFPPCNDSTIMDVHGINYEKILSENVRIS